MGLEKSAVIERLLEDKKNERVGRQLEEVLGKLGKPMDQKGVELLGFVDLEKIASDLIRPDIGINQFCFFQLNFSSRIFELTLSFQLCIITTTYQAEKRREKESLFFCLSSH